MLDVLDSTGERICIKDKVKFTLTQGGLFSSADEVDKEVEGIVVGLLDETTVQVQPDEGPSMSAQSNQVTILESLIKDVREMTGSEELKAILENAEARYDKSIAQAPKKTRKRADGGVATPKVVKPTGTMDLSL